MFRLSPWLLLLPFLLLEATGCATNPYTKRWQLLMIPRSYEANLGTQAYQDVLSDPKVTVSKNPAEVGPVERTAARIIEAAKRSQYAEAAKDFKWEVTVIKDDGTKNAFALPGGKIAVYTGIFPVADNESGLAAIIGHEVVHALARHGSERMSQGVLAQIGLIGASIAMQTQGFSPATSQAAMSALGVGTQVGVFNSHTMEDTQAVVYHAALVGAWSRQPYILSLSYGTDVQKGDIRSRGRADEYVRRGVFLVRLTVAPRLSRAFRPRDDSSQPLTPLKGVIE